MQNDEVNPQQKSSREKFNPKVFKLKRIPDNFLSSDLSKSAFTRLIRQIELCRENQNGIDDLYETFSKTVYDEMNKNIPSFDTSKRTKKLYKTYKPYCNEELENLWCAMHKCE